ncbi:hypothetical protein GIY23_16200 [Allosaccharopolyspora coralli]|uniref:Antitoxin FitA-like ribbon-helix-helix domain-containing protein n=1 Tax=Allosaccharopolyspora coralli TaxID=2665642 RepID=A0A5Q3Q8Z8_9PSEU|nr:hypothetical protein [Allosaccharopolyspora coralli]QGK70853.1 hypothetical protein GIY23_16200 [Allosaccharopolyspora coralli]
MDTGHRLTIREVDPADVDALKAAASAAGRSLNAYLRAVLHDHARTARNRRLLAALDHDHGEQALPADLDAAAEVRALRDERDAVDDQRAGTRA